jgi:hypothetical protein
MHKKTDNTSNVKTRSFAAVDASHGKKKSNTMYPREGHTCEQLVNIFANKWSIN